MSDFFTFMGAPIVACLILSVVYTYFGCHVLKREIIFVDLSLAQLAALGTTVAFSLELELDSIGSLGLSLAFILAGSSFFTYSRRLNERIPQEAIIGLVYVVGASLALILSSRSPHGAEHIKTLLNGSILWITWNDILKISCVTLLIAIPHALFFNTFLDLSKSYKTLGANEPSTLKWDFLFYVTLGLMIVFTVKTAGIFLIFSFLIIPAICGALFSRSIIKQCLIGSVTGVSASLAGLIISFFYDLPTGATLVCTFGLFFILALSFSKAER